MASLFLIRIYSLAVLCGLINGQSTGYATHSFTDFDVDVTIQIDGGNATIDICGPSGVWFAIGFGGGLMMDISYAIIVTNDGTAATAEEYALGNGHTLGDKKATQQITLTATSFSNDELCVTLERDAALNNAEYFDFPTAFDTSAAHAHDIIAAKGGSMSVDGHSSNDRGSTTLTYAAGIAPTAEPSLSPTISTSDPTEAPQVTNDVVNAEEDSAICFSSDSYVLTYPDFKRKAVKDVNIYDKILTYDELKDTYFWDELLVKIHFEEGEFLNNVLIEMREFILSNGERLTMSDNHLLFVGHSGLQRADQVKLGDKLKVFDGSYADVIGIEESVMRYGRNLITYNGNLVINGVAISTFTESIWGESPSWGKWVRNVMKYGHTYDVWRVPAYFTAKAWNEFASVGFKDAVLRFYFDEKSDEMRNENASWFTTMFTRK